MMSDWQIWYITIFIEHGLYGKLLSLCTILYNGYVSVEAWKCDGNTVQYLGGEWWELRFCISGSDTFKVESLFPTTLSQRGKEIYHGWQGIIKFTKINI